MASATTTDAQPTAEALDQAGVPPTNGWTGGQYSLWRFLAGVFLAAAFVNLWFIEFDAYTWMVAGPGVVAAFLMAIGYADRVAGAFAGALALPAAYWTIAQPGYDTAMAFVLAIGVLHALIPRAPYGSAMAAGRDDPAGNWRMPALQLTLARVAMLVGAVLLAVMITRGSYDVLAGVGLLLLILLSIDPAWLGRGSGEAAPGGRVFYDGHCGLCHRFVRFVLAEDRDGLFAFTPQQSDAFEQQLDPDQRADAGDTVFVKGHDGRLYTRSRASAKVLTDLGGWWRVLGGLLWLIPRPLADAGYNLVAKVRLRVFGTRADTCPMMPPTLRERFKT